MPAQKTAVVIGRYLIILSLLFGTLAPPLNAQETIYLPVTGSSPTNTTVSEPATETPYVSHIGLFRTLVTVRTSAQWKTLERLAVTILEESEDQALVLVDDQQLADLARLRFNPEQTNSLETMAASSEVVASSIGSLLAQFAATKHAAANQTNAASVRSSLRTSVQTLNTAQLSTLATAANVDSDGDGLTDDQEAWWCTDPNNANSDLFDVSDGDEVAALKAWMNNQLSQAPSSGKPFQGWPSTIANCFDDDRDSIPDVAESLELGLNPNRESTDLDKFDDGQELFGFTDCPGGDSNCRYGDLPRSDDAGFIGAKLPAYVAAPGNHPLVAAFPVPEVDVVESSLKVETVSVVTIEEVITEGTEKTYSTAETSGTSTSVANSQTWNDWVEVSESLETSIVRASSANEAPSRCWFFEKWWGSDGEKEQCIVADTYYKADNLAKDACSHETGGGFYHDIQGNAGAGLDWKMFEFGGNGTFGHKSGETQYSDLLTGSACLGGLKEARETSPEWNEARPPTADEIKALNGYEQVDTRTDPIDFDSFQKNRGGSEIG